jgi:hypothetical protein
VRAGGLGDRWRTPEGQALAEEAVARLVAGRGLDGLGLGWHEGRVDLRGLPVPVPARLRRFESQGWFVEILGNLITFRGARLRGLDLSGAQLQSLRFFGSQIADCRLDGANCQDWRLWDTEVADCGLSRARLRTLLLGLGMKAGGTYGGGWTSPGLISGSGPAGRRFLRIVISRARRSRESSSVSAPSPAAASPAVSGKCCSMGVTCLRTARAAADEQGRLLRRSV